jgi:hypothetical protein
MEGTNQTYIRVSGCVTFPGRAGCSARLDCDLVAAELDLQVTGVMAVGMYGDGRQTLLDSSSLSSFGSRM